MHSTLDSRFPAAVPLVPKAFHPERFTGDLMVTALPGWSFLRRQKGDHGNLERDAMLTPLILNGPGIEAATAPPLVRLVDLFRRSGTARPRRPGAPRRAGSRPRAARA